MGGRGPAQMVAPLQSKPICVEIGEAREHVLDRPCVVRSRRRRRRCRADVAESRRIAITPLDALWVSRRDASSSRATRCRPALRRSGRRRCLRRQDPFDAVDRSALFVRPIDCRREAALAQAGQRCACRVRKPPRHSDQLVDARAAIPLKQFDHQRQLRPASREDECRGVFLFSRR